MNSYDFEISPLGEILINYFKEGIIAIGVDIIVDEDSIEFQFIKYMFVMYHSTPMETALIRWFDEYVIILYGENNTHREGELTFWSHQYIVSVNKDFKCTKDIIYLNESWETNQKEVVEVVNLTDFINKYVTVKYYEEV